MIIRGCDYSGPCPCGQTHAMTTELSVVEAGCLQRFRAYLAQVGLEGTVTAVYDENTWNARGLTRPDTDHAVILPAQGLHANEAGVEALKSRLPGNTRILAAVGSGTVHDISRYTAWELGLDFVSCPTAASVDGFCSGVAAMTWEGAKRTLTAVAPRLVLADLEVISRAPLRLTRSGFGDMLGKYIALADWQLGHLLTGEHHCEKIARITREATEAVLAAGEGILRGAPAAYEKLTAGLLLSGLAMQLLGTSRPASGAEHHISHLIEMEPPALNAHSDALHGEKVGVGTLLAAREYHRLAALPETAWGDFSPYTAGEIRAVFGKSLGAQIEAENKNEPCAAVTGRLIREKLPAIRELLRAVPDPQTLEAVYDRLGLCRTLADIAVEGAAEASLLAWAPMVRSRSTLLRLRRCLEV